MNSCTFEILLTDRDFDVAKHMLEHQLSVVAPWCAEIILTLNRFPQPTAPVERMNDLVAEFAARYDKLRVIEVDGSAAARSRVADAFFEGHPYPLFDFKGTPIHAILAPILEAAQPYYFHVESDMLLGGDFQRWLRAGIAVLKESERTIAVNPLGGPPRSDGVYSTPESPHTKIGDHEGHRIATMNTRVFLIHRNTFSSRLTPIPIHAPTSRRDRMSSMVRGGLGPDLLERLMSERMATLGVHRFDLGGSSSQPAWTLHPLHKTSAYIAALGEVIAKVETGDLPDGQRGKFDVDESLIELPDIPSQLDRWSRAVRSGAVAWRDRLRRTS